MIISAEKLKQQVQCGTMSDDVITARLDAIEAVIRTYTNNNFQIRAVRFDGHCDNSSVYGSPRYFTVGDTVQISASNVNDGLYTVIEVTADKITVDKPLIPYPCNLVTKIQYPPDVVQCAVDLFRWKLQHGDKVGVKSETLSRHSVTYEDSTTLYMGYPVGILNGLQLYRKVRC